MENRNYTILKDIIMKLILSFSLFLVAQVCLADIPHSFTAGTPASASEVNENFSNLDERVSVLETSSNQGSDSTDNNYSYPADTLHTIAEELTYTPKEGVLIGQEVSIGQKDYRIYRFPVKSLTDDSLYAMTLPLKIYQNYSTRSNQRQCWDPENENLNNYKTLFINEIEVILNVYWDRSYNLYKTEGNTSSFDVDKSIDLSICIKFDQFTILTLWLSDIVDVDEYMLCHNPVSYYSSEKCQENTEGFTFETYDLINDQFNSMYSNEVDYDVLDDFIDYLSVEKIQ
jgi:hypothetical protein